MIATARKKIILTVQYVNYNSYIHKKQLKYVQFIFQKLSMFTNHPILKKNFIG